MRIASLIMALIAGLLGTAAIVFGVFGELVPVLIGLGVYPPDFARLTIALLPAIVLFASGMTIAAPLFSAFLLFVAGIGWGGAAFLARQSGLFAVMLLAITGLAFILAILGAFRRGDRELVEEDDEEEAFEPVRPPLPTQRFATMAPVSGEPHVPGLLAEEPAEADDPEEEAPRADAEAEPEPTVYAAADPGDGQPEFGPDRDYFGEPRQPIRRFEPYDPAAARGGSGWRRALIAANIVLLGILIAGGGTLVYLDHARGSRSVLFGKDGLFNQIDLAITPPSGSGPGKPVVATAEPKAFAPAAPAKPAAPAAAPAFDAAEDAEDAGRRVSNPDVSPLAPPIPAVAVAAPPNQPAPAESLARAATSAMAAPQTATPTAEVVASAADPGPAPVQVAANENGPGAASMTVPQPAPAPEAQPEAAPAQPTQIAQASPNDPAAPIPAPPLPDRIPHPAPSPAAASAPAAAPAPAAQPAPEVARQPAQPPDTRQAAAAGPTYSDPFQYCEAVDTVDAPDARYAGPAVPQAIAARLGANTPAAIAETHWRCLSRNVMACRVTGKSPVCDKLPTVDEMIAYCKANRSTGPMLVAAGDWSCKGGVPIIPKNQSWPVDRRGFFPPAWAPVPNTAATNG